MDRVTLLGISVDACTTAQAVQCLRAYLQEERPHHVVTPNSEMLVAAQRSPRFAQVLRQASFAVPDSAGLLFAARWTGQQLPERVAGVDLITALCSDIGPGHPVFLLGGHPGVAEAAAETLRRLNPRIAIAGSASGSPSADDAPGLVDAINAASPHILLVAFGAPQQDLWIADHLSALPSVRLALGVGGTLDFLAGTQTRAPRWMRAVHLEWLWRLIREPRRWKRILTAVVVFPLMVLRYGKRGKVME